MSEEKPTPFESFTAVYEVLAWAGFFKLLNKPKNRIKGLLHQIYRPFALMVAILYNIPLIIFIIQKRHNINEMFDSTMIELPQMLLVVKVFTLNFNIPRVDNVNKLLHDPIFEAYTKKDEEMLLQTTNKMHRCVRIMKISMTVALFVWPASLFARKYQDPAANASIYVPFATDTWTGYSYSVLLEVLPIPWTGFGHLALDCLIATYYAQAEVQLKIIKYNLEHLFDTDDASRDYELYRDVVDKELRNRFIHYVKRYEAVTWYTKEIGKIFNPSMSIQFFCATVSLCVVSYRMSSTPVLSVTFVFLLLIIVVTALQVFMYCYFGNIVQYESDLVVTSLYLSDWSSASPQLRRLLLMAMLRWSHCITPRVSGIVPLSLSTFVSVLRSAYSLFAVLSTK